MKVQQVRVCSLHRLWCCSSDSVPVVELIDHRVKRIDFKDRRIICTSPFKAERRIQAKRTFKRSLLLE